MAKKTKWTLTGQVQSVTHGQKKDVAKIGKGEMVSTIAFDSGALADMAPGDGARIKIEVDPKLNFDED